MATPAPAFPTLDLEKAKAALAEAIAAFEIPEHKERMETAIASCDPTNPMAKMQTLIPIVQEIQGTVMAKYGFEGPGAVMAATMQINMFAPQDPEIANGVRMLAAKLSGN
ncbi:hypothetical protein TrVE_jg1192 [Triparma verrucosa]|uniref:Protein C10 n=2 Tax=Triparma TaxID=722752 RepID=A0A9W7A4Y6_9STRA|nr:hypothetical protein TrST_g9906 [Triparma strigata]GMH98155.1 hypothetical protein TrVE_jg1192 [Triparma verrucosa]